MSEIPIIKVEEKINTRKVTDEEIKEFIESNMGKINKKSKAEMLSKSEIMKGKVMKVKISSIKIYEDLYPRIKVDENTIQTYVETIDDATIVINQNKILVDGRHRLESYKRRGLTEIDCIIENIPEDEILLRAIELNGMHGLQLSYKEKKRLALKLYNGKNKKQLVEILNVSKDCFNKWTRNIEQERKKEIDKAIIQEYLNANLTLQEVADKFDIGNTTVSDKVRNFSEKINLLFSEKPPKSSTEEFSEIYDFTPYPSNVWIVHQTGHFDEEDVIIDINVLTSNLLYYYTKPFDVVYINDIDDAIKTCKNWYRRYLTGELNKKPNFAFLIASDKLEPLVKNLKNKMEKGYIAIFVNNLEQDISVSNMMIKLGFKLDNRIILAIPDLKRREKMKHGYEELLVYSVE